MTSAVPFGAPPAAPLDVLESMQAAAPAEKNDEGLAADREAFGQLLEQGGLDNQVSDPLSREQASESIALAHSIDPTAPQGDASQPQQTPQQQSVEEADERKFEVQNLDTGHVFKIFLG